MAEYCTPQDVAQYVSQIYRDRLAEENPQAIALMIPQVSGEIDDRLRGRYSVPLSHTPPVIRWICAVITGYRCLGGLTSLMNTYAETANDLAYIQKEYHRALEELEDIAKGEVKLDADELVQNPVLVKAPPQIYTPELMKRFNDVNRYAAKPEKLG